MEEMEDGSVCAGRELTGVAFSVIVYCWILC
jgi:hypothetical protein